MTRARVLVVDDKDTMVKLLARVLSTEFDVTTAADGTRALGLIASQPFDVIISDIRMPGADGMAVLRETHRVQPDAEVILMTAFATVQAAVDAMKQGAYDYLQKPFEPDEALLLVRRAAERKHLRTQARDLEAALAGAHRFENVIAESPPMRKVLELVQRAAGSDATVLITGESGAGKEVIAHAIHSASSRSPHRFVAINCGAMPEPLFEAELFGYVKGAFTGASADRSGLFEEASGGTLFLDEIGELPLAMQVKLNRALQERTIRRVGDSTERLVDVPRPTQISRPPSPDLASARISTTESTCSPSTSRRYASARAISRCSRRCSSSGIARRGSPKDSRPRHSRHSSITTGPATCASSRTWCSAHSWSAMAARSARRRSSSLAPRARRASPACGRRRSRTATCSKPPESGLRETTSSRS
jgi:CheY-like chemotaxis protein